MNKKTSRLSASSSELEKIRFDWALRGMSLVGGIMISLVIFNTMAVPLDSVLHVILFIAMCLMLGYGLSRFIRDMIKINQDNKKHKDL